MGPKLFVDFNDPLECVRSGVHAFDAIATANHTVAFPQHLDRIRDRNTAAEKEKMETSLKRAQNPTSTTRLSKRPFSCSSQSKSAPSAKTATTWQPSLSQASSSRDYAVYDGGRAASQQSDHQHVTSDTSGYEWQASSSNSWYGGRAASQQPGPRSNYYQSDYQSAYLQSPVNSSWYGYERKKDTESGNDPWHNWKPSDQWEEKKW